MNFTHLHCHSYYSMMSGTVSLERLCQQARAAGMKSLALTDLGGVYAWVEFVQTCAAYDLKPIVGVDLQSSEASVVLLAKNQLGYERLCHLTSAWHEAATTLEAMRNLLVSLSQDRHHLVVLSRHLGLLKKLYRKTGAEDLAVEILPRAENISRLEFAKQTGVVPIATNDVYFAQPQEWYAHRLLRAIDTNSTLSQLDPQQDLVSPYRYFCDEATLRRELAYAPESVDNAIALAETLSGSWSVGTTIFPPFDDCGDSEAYSQLRWKCYQGAQRRYRSLTPQVTQRLDYELKVIREKGFTHYFLVVDDIVRQAPRTCGRGSVAASLVSYCLGITHVDPLAQNLLFERFLNPGRSDPPDADIDFPWDEREDILDYIFDKYGPYQVGMVANHVRLKKRAALREIAKVYGLAENEIKVFSEQFRRTPASRVIPEPWNKIIQWADALDGFPRHLSLHCGGVVIVPDDLRRYVPVETAAKGVRVIQWEKDQAEDFGLVKIDILGNRSLAVVRDALSAVELNTGNHIAYDQLDPKEDVKTQEMVKRGETMGVFYVESPATRQLQQKARVGDYAHLVIHSSIIRPAAHRFINEYVERLHGKPFDPIHPLLKETLQETFGIMVYQEDVTKTAMAIAGFDAAAADGLRKALSKKRPEKKLQAYRSSFVSGARRRGVKPEVIDKIWEMILSFAGYSFCKPHSASYALVSFQSAYLRAHYPAEFMAAVLSNGGGYYSTFAYLSEARRMGLTILPPDINASFPHYWGKGSALRIGFQAIKGLSSSIVTAIMDARESGAFCSLEDFLKRVAIDIGDAKLLIRAGCFDSIAEGHYRPQLIWKLIQLHQVKQSWLSFSFRPKPAWVPNIKDYSDSEKIQDEQEIFGFLFSRHPLSCYQAEATAVQPVLACDLSKHVGRKISMLAWLITRKLVRTKHHEAMSFVSFEDQSGIFETVFFPQVYRRDGVYLNSREPFLLNGTLYADHGTLALHVDRAQAISQWKKRQSKGTFSTHRFPEQLDAALG